MSNNNRITGNRFEQELSHILAQHGFWSHVMQQNKAGQPADIIAVKGKFHTLIDGKVVSNEEDGFQFKNIRENQRTAMKKFTRCGGELCYFAIGLPWQDDGSSRPHEKIRLISLSRIETLESRGHKSITPKMMDRETWNLDDWLDSSNTWAEDT